MKFRVLPISAALFALAFVGCNKSDDEENSANTDVEFAKAGNTFTPLGNASVGGTSVALPATATVLSNDKGVATIKLEMDLTGASYSTLNSLIPASMKDGNGKVSTNIKMRVTTEGISDFINSDGKEQTLVKYSDPVGTQYKLAKSNSTTITRTVTENSGLNDFPFGLYKIKTVKVEQDSRVTGVKKFVVRANHHYGIVYFEVVASDDSSSNVTLVSNIN